MAAPDFSSKTRDTLAKRAMYVCSNPDCRKNTVGPNSDDVKSILIGEAAHIRGARSHSKRYTEGMSDFARAEITNGIWLCRNCHKIIDSDDCEYSTELLYAWRKEHESYAAQSLGTTNDRLSFEIKKNATSPYGEYPPYIRRIITDKPAGWEFRLAAELLRHHNKSVFRNMRDLREGRYSKQLAHIDENDAQSWLNRQIADMARLLGPLSSSINYLVKALGAPGEAGNLEEIVHGTKLVRDSLIQIVEFEERTSFTKIPESLGKAKKLTQNTIIDQLGSVEAIPDNLDNVVDMIGTDHGGTPDNPLIVTHYIDFKLPDDWVEQMNREIKKLY